MEKKRKRSRKIERKKVTKEAGEGVSHRFKISRLTDKYLQNVQGGAKYAHAHRDIKTQRKKIHSYNTIFALIC